MHKRIFRIVTWILLGAAVSSVWLFFRKPHIPPVETSPQAARSFDQKLAEIEQHHSSQRPQTIHISETELNSKLQQSLREQSPAQVESTTLKAITMQLENGQIVGSFTVDVRGVDVILTLAGKLGVHDHELQFTPTRASMGSLPIPAFAIRSALRDKLNSPEVREQLKLPESIKGIRIENREILLEME